MLTLFQPSYAQSAATRAAKNPAHPPAAGSNPRGGHTILIRRVVPPRSLGVSGWALWTRGSLPSLKLSTRSHPPAAVSACAPATADRAFTGGAQAAAARTAPPACRQRPGIPTGGKRMPPAAAWRSPALRGGCGPCGRSPVTNSSALKHWAVGRLRRTVVTWLILPVVICLFQRLSHACLSISNYTAKLRMAH